MTQYHDDGEKELGPVVASLSLGAPAVMKWRPKTENKINIKKDKNGSYKKDKHGKPAGVKATILELSLEHGDFMVMEGAGIQKYYEVSPAF
jgi:alkylated DNA repair dioxygenase AlkB